MCGIVGYVSKIPITDRKFKELLDSTNLAKHRGPNGGGFTLINSKTGQTITHHFYDGKDLENPGIEVSGQGYDVFLGHRRLSIFDLSERGYQPMNVGEDIICFNGEIYNFLEIKQETKIENVLSNTDTEIALKNYQIEGHRCLQKFNGMWSMLIWDHNKRQLFVSNDRFGVKPLYYFENEDEKIFCSEVKQFKAFDSIRLSFDKETIEMYLQEELLDTDENTFYKQVKRFLPGHYSMIEPEAKGKLIVNSYYSLPTQSSQESEEIIQQLDSLMDNAVEIRTRADVEWGVAVSGGLDSSIIHSKVSKLAGVGSTLTFSAIFPGMEGDESQHIFNLIDRDSQNCNLIYPFEEFTTSDLEKHIYHQDFPIATTSFYAEWCVSRRVEQEGVKVILNGQGADEVFAGYHMHFYIHLRTLILKGKVGSFLAQVEAYAELKNVSKLSLFRIVFGDLKLWVKFKLSINQPNAVLSRYFVKDLYQGLKNDIFHYQLPTNLRSDDRDGMAFGIESRHPFMDYRVIDLGMRLPDKFKLREGWQKWILREMSPQLPKEIRYRKDKKGYTTPQKDILSKEKSFMEKYNKIGADLMSPNYNYDRLAFLGIWLNQF